MGGEKMLGKSFQKQIPLDRNKEPRFENTITKIYLSDWISFMCKLVIRFAMQIYCVIMIDEN